MYVWQTQININMCVCVQRERERVSWKCSALIEMDGIDRSVIPVTTDLHTS